MKTAQNFNGVGSGVVAAGRLGRSVLPNGVVEERVSLWACVMTQWWAAVWAENWASAAWAVVALWWMDVLVEWTPAAVWSPVRAAVSGTPLGYFLSFCTGEAVKAVTRCLGGLLVLSHMAPPKSGSAAAAWVRVLAALSAGAAWRAAGGGAQGAVAEWLALWLLTEVLWGVRFAAVARAGSGGEAAVHLWANGCFIVLWCGPLFGWVVWAVLGLAAGGFLWERRGVGTATCGGSPGAGLVSGGVEVGGFPVSTDAAAAIEAVWRADSQASAWPAVRLHARTGDCLLKVLLTDYVGAHGGSVADESALESTLLSDAAFQRFVQVRKAQWWSGAPVHMRGKPSTTIVEASWGVVWCTDTRVLGARGDSGEACFASFLRDVANCSGFMLDGVKLRPAELRSGGEEAGADCVFA